MRILLIAVLTVLLAWGLWALLQSPEQGAPPLDEPPPEGGSEPGGDGQHASDRARLSTGTLVVTVRTPGGDAPPGAEAGYVYAGEPRLKTLTPTGEARFTDAPLGTLTILARAPGYVEVRQRRAVLAGLRADVLILLRPEKR